MTISCDSAKTLAIVFGVYAGILTGVLLGFFLLWCLKRKKTIPKAKKSGSSGIDNVGFAETGLGVTPERLREDLSAQRRNRQDATPIPSRRESSPTSVVNRPRPSVAESYHSATVEPDSSGMTSRPVTYLELQASGGLGTGVAAGEEFASLKSSESASTLYDDVQSIGSKSKTSLREARNSVSSANAVFYDAKDVDSVILMNEDEKIYQEIPDPARGSSKINRSSSSSSSSSTSTLEDLYDDALVTSRPRKKAAPPPPPPKPKRVIDDIYDDISVQDQPEVRKSSNPQDLEDARKSYQEAPEKYRKASNYIDLDSKGNSPLVKKDIEKMISTLGEESSSSSSSDSSSSSVPETFQRRKSSYSSPSSEVENEVQDQVQDQVQEDSDVFSINTNPISIDSEDDDDKVQNGKLAPLRRVANVDLGSSIEHPLEGDLSDSGSSNDSSDNDDTTTSGSETLDEADDHGELKFEPPEPELKPATDVLEILKEIEPEMIELKQAVELDLEPEAPKVEPFGPTVEPFEPIVEHRQPELQHATQVLDEGQEVHLCTPAVIRTDDDSSSEIIEVKAMTKVPETEGTSESYESSTESSSEESSSSSESSEDEPKPVAKLERKSSSSSGSKLRSSPSLELKSSSKNDLSKKPTQSSSSSSSSSSSEDEMQVQSNGFDHNLYANLPPIQRNAKSLSLPSPKRNSSSSSEDELSSSSSKPRKKLKNQRSDISDSFLRNLNRNYQPVYYLRKVNSETQTDKGNKETEA